MLPCNRVCSLSAKARWLSLAAKKRAFDFTARRRYRTRRPWLRCLILEMQVLSLHHCTHCLFFDQKTSGTYTSLTEVCQGPSLPAVLAEHRHPKTSVWSVQALTLACLSWGQEKTKQNNGFKKIKTLIWQNLQRVATQQGQLESSFTEEQLRRS